MYFCREIPIIMENYRGKTDRMRFVKSLSTTYLEGPAFAVVVVDVWCS